MRVCQCLCLDERDRDRWIDRMRGEGVRSFLLAATSSSSLLLPLLFILSPHPSFPYSALNILTLMDFTFFTLSFHTKVSLSHSPSPSSPLLPTCHLLCSHSFSHDHFHFPILCLLPCLLFYPFFIFLSCEWRESEACCLSHLNNSTISLTQKPVPASFHCCSIADSLLQCVYSMYLLNYWWLFTLQYLPAKAAGYGQIGIAGAL